ncbi:hypothetical protein ACEN88_36105, partial [Massilia sp. CT11-108]
AVGFVWLPRAHARDAMASIWESICSAAGAPAPYRSPDQPDEKAVYPTSVIVSSEFTGPIDNVAVPRAPWHMLHCRASVAP